MAQADLLLKSLGNQSNGYAALDGSGKVSSAVLPSPVSGLDTRVTTLETKATTYRPSVTDAAYGAKADLVDITDAGMTSGSATLTTSTTNFTSADVGKAVQVSGAGAAGANAYGTITAYTDSHHVTLSFTASTTVAGASAKYGTNNTAAFDAFRAAVRSGRIPGGRYYGRLTGIDSYQSFLFEDVELVLPPGTNGHTLSTRGFDSYVGTNDTACPHDFEVLGGVAVDANRGVNSSGGKAIAVYGYKFVLDSLIGRNSREHAAYIEGPSQSAFESFPPNGMETTINRLHLHSSAKGLTFNGPHDSHVDDVIITKCGDSVVGSIAFELPEDGKSNGSVFSNVHVYGGTHDYGLYCKSAGVRFEKGIQLEGARVAQAWIDAAQVSLIGFKLFPGGVSTASVKGLILGSSGNYLNLLELVGKIENCGGGAVDVTYAGDHNTGEIRIMDYSSTLTVGYTAVIGSMTAKNSLRIIHTDRTFNPTAYSIDRFRGQRRNQAADDTQIATRNLRSSASATANLHENQDETGNQLSKFDPWGRLCGGTSSVVLPTIGAPATPAAGSGATYSISGSDMAGTFTFTTGTGPTAGQMCKITWSHPYPATARVMLIPRSANAAALMAGGLWVAPSTTDVTINVVATPSASTAYQFDLHVIA